MSTVDFPLIYCNGDSYSNPRYHSVLENNTYDSVIARKFNGYVINKSISGSWNRRIIRTTISDMLIERKINPRQKIIVLLGLSFELRSEIWIDDLADPVAPEESNFKQHTFSGQTNWRDNLLKNIDIETNNRYNANQKFYKKYSEGRAFFFSPYAERINLLCDIIMLRKFFESMDIGFLIFQSPKAETLESDFLLDQFRQELVDDHRILNFETFGFCDWAYEQGFVPLDHLDTPRIGHYGPDAHNAFAERVLIPRLISTKQI